MLKLIGIPYDGNSSYLRGAASAPAKIREIERSGSTNAYSESGLEILNGKKYIDLCDILIPEADPKSVYEIIKEKISHELTGTDRIICFGGDHSISFPVIEIFTQRYKDLNVLQFDAHPDLYENYGDNQFSHASPFARLMERRFLKSLTQVGVRTLNAHQRDQADRYNVKIIEMKRFSHSFISELNSPLYISLDLDVLDPSYAPGISHHEPGGMTTRELIKIIQSIPVTIVGADIVEYNPARDINNMTAMVAYKLFKELASKMLD